MSTYSMTQEDRAFVIDRLDHEHIEELAEKISLGLELGHAVEACYQPGDATWYSLVFGRCTLVGAAGGGGKDNQNPPSFIGVDRVFVAYVQQNTLASFGEHDDPEWVAGKLSPDNRASALAIAELIREVMR